MSGGRTNAEVFCPSSEGPNKNAREHFANHGRLTHVREEPSDELARHNHGGQGEEDLRQGVPRVSRRLGEHLSGGGRRRDERFAVLANHQKQPRRHEDHRRITGGNPASVPLGLRGGE